MLKHLLFTMLFVCSGTLWLGAQSQDLQQYIGQENVFLVFNFSPNATYEKLGKETRDAYDINEMLAPMVLRLAGAEATEESIKKVSKQLEDPAKVGVVMDGQAYFWVQQPTGVEMALYEKDASPFMINFALPVSDQKKFRNFLNSLMPKEIQEKIGKMGSGEGLINDGMLLQWDKKHLVLASSTIEYNFYEEMDEFLARREKIMQQHSDMLLKIDAKSSLASDKEYQAGLNKEADFNMWFNYDHFEQDPGIYPREVRGLMRSLASLTKGNRINIHGFFRNGMLEVAADFQMNDAIKRMTDVGYKKGGIDTKFYRYIDKTNLMGLFTMSTNTTALFKAYGEEIYKAFQESDARESELVVNGLDIVDIFLDEEEIYGLFQGDVAVAVNDLRVVQVERSDFQYDEEADQWDEVTVTEEEVIPIATMMASMGNAQNIQHFIDLGATLGLLTKQSEGVWTVKEIKEETGMDFYIITHDDLLMFSNDAELPKNLKSGVPKGKQLSAASIKELSACTQYLSIDMTKISEVTKSVYERTKDKAPNEIMEVAKILDRMDIKSYYPNGNVMESDFILQFQDKETNVLDLMFEGASRFLLQGESMEPGETPQEEEEVEEEEGVKRL